jgi:signal transduction histidine kinase
MSLRKKVLRNTGFEPMSHRPPLSHRFWFYSAAAFLLPVIVQVAIPEDPSLADELIWLVTLVPAFLLSLHYGLWGAFAALLMGTVLFLVVQLVLALNFTADDWRITVPIYIAYGAIAISVGSLSEQLHRYYNHILQGHRMVTIGEFAVTVRHEINNALTAIVTESELLSADDASLTEDQKQSARNIHKGAMRIAEVVRKITRLEDAPVTDYAGMAKMVDLASARERS